MYLNFMKDELIFKQFGSKEEPFVTTHFEKNTH